MKSSIFIPQKIKVGFQKRDNTYTGKLAYVIYYDHKGVLRKEKSWINWIDKDIETEEYINLPTSGFVMNKKVGDYTSDWNHRQAYVRIYDERNFEFEITIENLLYILENANSIKGKGLEGEFVYAWDGKELVLLPVESPDYQEISSFNKILHEKNFVKAKDLIIGATYKSKDNQEWIYMGRFDLKDTKSEQILTGKSSGYWSSPQYTYVYHNISKGKHHFFVKESEYTHGEKYKTLSTIKSLGDRFIEVVSSECAEDYAEWFDWVERQTEYSHRDKSKDEWMLYSLSDFEEYIKNKEFKDTHWGSVVDLYIEPDKTERVHYDINTSQFYKDGNYVATNREYERIYIGDIHTVYELYSPMYKNEYLENGKLYRRIG